METLSNNLDVTINFKHNFTLKLSENSKLSDLKNAIKNETLMAEDEYEIYVKDLQLLIINQDLSIKNLIDSYQTKEFTIKAYKSILILFYFISDVCDLKQQLIEFDEFLDFQICESETQVSQLEATLKTLKEEINI
jgi:hypothetical protein